MLSKIHNWVNSDVLGSEKSYFFQDEGVVWPLSLGIKVNDKQEVMFHPVGIVDIWTSQRMVMNPVVLKTFH